MPLVDRFAILLLHEIEQSPMMIVGDLSTFNLFNSIARCHGNDHDDAVGSG